MCHLQLFWHYKKQTIKNRTEKAAATYRRATMKETILQVKFKNLWCRTLLLTICIHGLITEYSEVKFCASSMFIAPSMIQAVVPSPISKHDLNAMDQHPFFQNHQWIHLILQPFQTLHPRHPLATIVTMLQWSM